jgi:glycosyltransferase involved in cell wall biosynthesis
MNRVLMIAYHFPPLAGSSGIQRTLRFVQHLPQFGWQPVVLTTHTRAYERTSQDLMADVPAGTMVRRAFALDTARHLQIAGRYPGWMARPDRWISWKFDGVRQGLALIKQFKPGVIWSTYPIASAHVIASALHRKSGIPWVADFRDPMAQEGYPADPLTWERFSEVEADAMTHARYCVFTTPGAARMYQTRYPSAADRIVVIENGYDEESFAAMQPSGQSLTNGHREKHPLVLLHSGVVYESERDPTQLFVALGRLMRGGRLSPNDLRIRFRAAVHEDLLRDLAAVHGASDFIELCPAIPYREALAEMMSVDALLILQASNCNAQIPAKVYEYLRAGRPILALTDPVGDTASVLRGVGSTNVARLDSADEIAENLLHFQHGYRLGTVQMPDPDAIRRASRFERAGVMANLLDRSRASVEKLVLKAGPQHSSDQP